MIRWIVRIGVAIAAVILVAVVGGLMLPVAHTATASRVVRGDPEAVWAVITDVDGFPSWRPDVERAERLEGSGRTPAWREHGPGGSLAFEVVEAEAARRLVTRILDEGQPFGGTWTYELEPEGTGTLVRLREDGEIHSPVFRFVARWLVGYEGTMRAYLEALADRMGEDPGAPVTRARSSEGPFHSTATIRP